jgi:hypothetical protein
MGRIAEAQPGENPVVLFDGDGTLRIRAHEAPEGYHQCPDSRDGFVNPDVALWIPELEEVANVYYLSSNYQDSNMQIGRVLGLSDLPWVDFPAAKPDNGELFNNDRRGAIQEFFPNRPVVWIEDELRPYDYGWAFMRTLHNKPTFLVKPNSECGLQRVHIDRTLAWLSHVASQPSATLR